MDANKDRFPLLRKVLKAIGLPAEAVDDIVERILHWLSTKDTPTKGFTAGPFKLWDDFLSAAEISFYQVLRMAVGDRALVFTKINLADSFFVSTGDQRQNRALSNRIDRKHVDFLLSDIKSVRPIVALELDDHSHIRADRKSRDELVEAVFAAAGLPLLRLPVKAGYSPREILALLSQHLQPAIFVPAPAPVTDHGFNSIPDKSPSASSPVAAPVCPKCGSTMALRVAKSGANAGGKFWGCSNFPRCRSMLPFQHE